MKHDHEHDGHTCRSFGDLVRNHPELREFVLKILGKAFGSADGILRKSDLRSLHKLQHDMTDQIDLAEKLLTSAELLRPVLAAKIAELEALPDDTPDFGPIAVGSDGDAKLPTFDADALNIRDLFDKEEDK